VDGRNAVVKPDANNNYKPLKEYKSSVKRIDGVITAVMAVGRSRRRGTAEKPRPLKESWRFSEKDYTGV
jgi:phage terminase large subunit-like protein